MKEVFKILTVVVVGLSLVFVIQFFALESYKFFGVKWENAKTDVYRGNKSYIEGTIRDLRDLKRQYIQADSEESKAGIRTLIIQRSGELDYDRLPSDLRVFLREL